MVDFLVGMVAGALVIVGVYKIYKDKQNQIGGPVQTKPGRGSNRSGNSTPDDGPHNPSTGL